MRPEQRAEARAILRSARELLRELAEEGFESPGADPARGGRAAAATAPQDAGASPVDPTPSPPAPASPAAEPADGPEGPADPRAGRQTLDEVRAWIGDCRRCRLSESRTRIVFGDGNPDADLLFVGEGPGQEEDRRGLPFVGRAGELLTRMIERGLGLPRSEVYICNVVKCRPPGNRTPRPDEIEACRPYLDAQIDAVAPLVIVALGRPAASALLGRDVAITRVRGTWHDYRGIPVMPTFHPAYLLRQYTEENRRAVWNDLKAALARVRERQAGREARR